MAGGTRTPHDPSSALPANEAALDDQLERAIRKLYPREHWTLNTHFATRSRLGLPDRLYCIRGRWFVWELKNPRRPAPITPRQRQEIAALERAGATVAIITSVKDALDQVADALGAPA